MNSFRVARRGRGEITQACRWAAAGRLEQGRGEGKAATQEKGTEGNGAATHCADG